MASTPAVGRVLRASVARPELGLSFEQAAAALPSSEVEALAAAAWFHGISGYVRAAAAAAGKPEVLAPALEAVVQHTVLRHLRALADLQALASALDDVTPWLVVKGPVLAETVHERPELRSYADLDLLVPPGTFGTALEALERAGARTRDRNWTLIGREMKGEVHVVMPLGSVVDLHWSLLNDRPVRDRYRISTAALFDRSRDVRVGGTIVRTLDALDTIVHLALHTMLSGGHRLLWLKDFERALAVSDAPPAELRERARSWGAELVLDVALSRTHRAIGCPEVPHGARSPRVTERAWLALSRAVWERVPAEREDGKGSLGRMVSRSVRPGVGASALVLGGKVVSRVTARGREDATPDPDSSGSDRYEAGGAAARHAYLEAVARQEA